MSKGLSSLFILSLLLLILWGIVAWSFGKSTKISLQNLFSEQVWSEDHLLNSELEYELLEFSNSIFGAKAKISIQASSENKLSFIGSLIDEKLILSVDSYNGPVFFGKSGINTGSSIWYIRFDKDLNDKAILDKFNLKQSPTAVIKIGLDEKIEYKLGVESDFLKLVLKGFYDPQTQDGFGEIAVDDFFHHSKLRRIESKIINLVFKHSNIDSKASITDFTVGIPEIIFQHQSMPKPIYLNANGIGKVSIDNNIFNSINNISFMQNQSSNYPLENGDINFQIEELSIKKLQNIIDSFSRLENLQQQTEWILEDHAEVPEGQNKIWQLQESIRQLNSNLPSLTNELLVKNNKPVAIFNLNTHYQNKTSTLTGGILPLSQRSLDLNDITPMDSPLSLFKAEAKVNLDKALLDYIATYLPIKKTSFELIYKQNKLLMH